MTSQKKKRARKAYVEGLAKRLQKKEEDKDILLVCMRCKDSVYRVKESVLERAKDESRPIHPKELEFVMPAHRRARDPQRVCISCPTCFDTIFDYNARGGFNVFPLHLQTYNDEDPRPSAGERYPEVDSRTAGIHFVQPYSLDPYGTHRQYFADAGYVRKGFDR